MSETEDLPPVIAVNWDGVERDIGHEVETDLQSVIEHEGSTSEVVLDKWGYADASTTPLFSAVREHAQIIHPERGTLDARYAPFDSMSAAVNVLKYLRGEDLNIGTVIEDGDDAEFVVGFADLYDAARELDKRRDDWREDQHPAVRFGSYGPDKLGSHYIHVAHTDQSIIEGINVEDLPIEREDTLAHGGKSYSSVEEHYTASFRHERYYSENTEPTVADERAEEIGFLGTNAGKRTLEQDFRENGIEYEEIGTVELGPADPDAALYEYQKGDETRYGVEWSQRIAIDDYVVRSLIFDEKPDAGTVATALTIEDYRRDGGRQ